MNSGYYPLVVGHHTIPQTASQQPPFYFGGSQVPSILHAPRVLLHAPRVQGGNLTHRHQSHRIRGTGGDEELREYRMLNRRNEIEARKSDPNYEILKSLMPGDKNGDKIYRNRYIRMALEEINNHRGRAAGLDAIIAKYVDLYNNRDKDTAKQKAVRAAAKNPRVTHAKHEEKADEDESVRPYDETMQKLIDEQKNHKVSRDHTAFYRQYDDEGRGLKPKRKRRS